MPDGNPRRYWETRATALACRINVAAWLARAAPALFAVATPFAIAVFALRRHGDSPAPAALGVALAFLAAGIFAGWRARRDYYNRTEARVLIESALRLDTRLTAATAGLVPWPVAPAKLPALVRWRLGAPLGWLAAAALLLALASYVPIPRDSGVPRFGGPPPSLLQTKEMLAALQDLKTADPAALEKLAERASELARRPADSQYNHSALEAADALRDQTAAATAALGRGLESAANALQSAGNDVDMKSAAGNLAAALQGLHDGNLAANKELLANLPANASQLAGLTPEQRAQLAQQLSQAGRQTRGVAGAAGAGAPVARPDGMAGKGDGPGGNGGPGGGGGTAPLTLSQQESDAGDGKSEGLTLGDLSRVSLGDKLGTTAGAHDVDPSKAAGPTSAGAIATPAQGGDAVWVNRLTPAERAALKNFFK